MSLTRLTEALTNTIVDSDGVVFQSAHRGDQAAIVDAARKWVTPPSEQAIEAAFNEYWRSSSEKVRQILRDEGALVTWGRAIEAYRVAEIGEET